jgi:hypothetical protein
MTQAQAAEAFGLTQPWLNALLKGRIRPVQPGCARERRQPRRIELSTGHQEGGLRLAADSIRAA